MKLLKHRKNEQGYALISALFLIVMLLVIGTLIMRSVTESQGMVKVSSDLLAAQSDAETRLALKLSEVRSDILSLKTEQKITLEMVRDKAASHVDAGSDVLDKDKLKYMAVVSAVGRSGSIKQTVSKKIEVTLSYIPSEPSPGGSGGNFALVSYGTMSLNGAIVDGSIYSNGAITNNNSTINGQKITGTPAIEGVSIPGKVDITGLFTVVDRDADNVRATLLATPPSEPSNLEVRQNMNYDKSVALKTFKLMNKAAITVNGDLYIDGEVTMETGSSITATGNIYIKGNLLLNGDGGLNISAGKVIRVYGTTNVNSKPTVTVSGNLYTNDINFGGPYIGNDIYVANSATNNLKGNSQFSLYANGSVTLGTDGITDFTGSIYSNNQITINGNNNFTLHGLNPGAPSEPDEPQEIVFDETNMIIK